MAYLFCEEHGREHVAAAQADQDYYQFLGETIVIASGAIKSPSWRCHRCNLRLRRGMSAYLVTAFPRCYAQNLDRYDYRTEQEYFRLETLDATVYGAEPPGGIPFPRQLLEIAARHLSGSSPIRDYETSIRLTPSTTL
jgi:hypothetical protein